MKKFDLDKDGKTAWALSYWPLPFVEVQAGIFKEVGGPALWMKSNGFSMDEVPWVAKPVLVPSFFSSWSDIGS